MFGTVWSFWPDFEKWFDKFESAICSKLNRDIGVKIISQTENVVKEIDVHIISVLVVD